MICDVLKDYAIDQEDPSDPEVQGDIRRAQRIIDKLQANPESPLNAKEIELIADWLDFYVCEVTSDFIAYTEDNPNRTPQDEDDLVIAKKDQQMAETFLSSVASFLG